jgi:hypothetical protein
MTIIWGILVIITGILGVMFTEQIYNFTGSIGFIENKFPGNSRAFIKLMSFVIIIVGILLLTGTSSFISNALGNFFSGLFNRNTPQ